MGSYFTEREFRAVESAENAFAAPIPTQIVSNGEYNPPPQTAQQKQVEERIKELADRHGARQGLDRREFLRTSSGMAAAFLAMNQIHGGNVFDVSEAEAADRAMADERAEATKNQFIFDVQTHFVHDDYQQEGFLGFVKTAAELFENTAIDPATVSVYHLKFENYVREIYMNSDTNLTVLSGAPFDDSSWEFLTNDAIAEARDMVNTTAGSKRMLAHAVVRPSQPGWMEEVDRAIETRPPDSWKLYTIGDPLSAATKYPFYLDDEELMYPFYEKADKAGIRTMCIHKGLMPADYRDSWPEVWKYQTPFDLRKAAADWPQLNFVIYHGCLRPFMDIQGEPFRAFQESGRIEWATELGEVAQEAGVSNIYAEMGTSFASSAVGDPRFCASVLGTWIKGLGASNVVWGTDSVLYGTPQWQIDAMRRIEIPEELQKQHGFDPLGPADGAVKNAIFGFNSARLYNLDLSAVNNPMTHDTFAEIKRQYRESGQIEALRGNKRYGYIARRDAA